MGLWEGKPSREPGPAFLPKKETLEKVKRSGSGMDNGMQEIGKL